MKATVTILKRSLQARKKGAEKLRDFWLAERRYYLKRAGAASSLAVMYCKAMADIYQGYARDFRDMIKGG